MAMTNLVDLNTVQLNYYSFVTSLDDCNGSFNNVVDLSIKICVPIKTRDVNVKVFKTITKRNEANT